MAENTEQLQKTLAEIKAQAPMAHEVLCMAAFLGDAPLPMEFGLNVEGGMHNPVMLNPAAAMFALAATLDPLLKAGLAVQEEGAMNFHVPEAVRGGAKEALPEAEHGQWIERACHVLNLCLPDAAVGNWAMAEPLMPHVFMCFQYAQEGLLHSAAANRLFHQTGFFLFHQEQFDQAIAVLEAALAIDVKNKGEQHPDIAADYEGLGMVCLSAGILDAAQSCYQRCLALRQDVFTEDNPLLAPAYDGLAHVLLAQGKREEAAQHWLVAGRIMAAVVGDSHPFVLECRENAQRYSG